MRYPDGRAQIDYLYIDGKHDYWTVSSDLKWSRHMPPGSPVLIHDCYSSIGVTLGILAHVLPSRTLAYERRVGSLALFRVAPPTTADRLRIIAEIPWWLRNVMVKVLLRLRSAGWRRGCSAIAVPTTPTDHSAARAASPPSPRAPRDAGDGQDGHPPPPLPSLRT